MVWIYPRRKAGGSGAAPAKSRGRQPMELTRSAVATLFSTPQGDAAQVLGISLTALKTVCRKLGISRWPYVRVKKALTSPFKFELVRNDSPVSVASLSSRHESRAASSAITVPRTSSGCSSSASLEPLHACKWGDGSMHANGGDAFVSSSRAWDGNTIGAGCKLGDGDNIEADCELGDDLGWLLWNGLAPTIWSLTG